MDFKTLSLEVLGVSRTMGSLLSVENATVFSIMFQTTVKVPKAWESFPKVVLPLMHATLVDSSRELHKVFSILS